MTRLSCCISLAAVFAALPQLAHANPTAEAVPAMAVNPATADAGSSATPEGTTRVTVEVETPAPTVEPPPAAEPPPVVTPTPPVHDARRELDQRYRSEIKRERKEGRALLTAGLVTGGAAYLFSSLAGAIAIDRSRDFGEGTRRRDQRRSFGRRMLIPGVGPALAIASSDRAVRSWGAGVAGLAQAVGAGIAIIGIHRLGRARRLERVRVHALATPDQAHVGLQFRF